MIIADGVFLNIKSINYCWPWPSEVAFSADVAELLVEGPPFSGFSDSLVPEELLKVEVLLKTDELEMIELILVELEDVSLLVWLVCEELDVLLLVDDDESSTLLESGSPAK